jgi:hypothetical protein
MAQAKSLMLAVSLALAACSEKAANSQPVPPPAPTDSPEDEDSARPVATLPPVAFKEHPAQVYTGPLAKPDFAKSGADAKTYRTRIRNAAAAGVSFGGKYAVMISGCGSGGCIFGYVIDETNGHAMALPVGGEEYTYLQLAFRPDSRFMRAIWKTSYGSEPETCSLQDFVIDEGKFRSVKKELLPGACPEMDDKTGKSSGQPY